MRLFIIALLFAISYAQTDPCSCAEGTGYSSNTDSCVEGSFTNCWECSTMDGCESITCSDAGCPNFMETYTCQCNGECKEYGNCCEDSDTCFGVDFSFEHPMVEGKNGFTASEIFTTGETVHTPNGHFYRPPGVLDGLGAKLLDRNTVRLYANHELSHDSGNEYSLANGLVLLGARVSFYDIDKTTREIIDAGLAYDTIIDRYGNEVTDSLQLHENENLWYGDEPGKTGMMRFCSAVLVEQGTYGMEDDIFFTGEEAGTWGDRMGGIQYALNTHTNTLWAVPDMGRAAYEAIVPLTHDDPNKVAFIIGDDHGGAPLKMYIGTKNPAGNFLQRNGLSGGDLYVWVPDDATIHGPDEFSGTGNTASGHFIMIEHITSDESLMGTNSEDENMQGYDAHGHASIAQIDILAEEVGAFRFARPEDVGAHKDYINEVIVQATGGQDYDQWGTTYHVAVSFSDMSATINIIYDGRDAGNGQFQHPDFGMRNADNLVWASNDELFFNEDRSTGEFGLTSGHEASIWEIDMDTGLLYRIAEVNRQVVPQTFSDGCIEKIGCWETSGIIDVSHLFDVPEDELLFILDLQAHKLEGGTIDYHDLKEASQLIFLSGPKEVPGILIELVLFHRSKKSTLVKMTRFCVFGEFEDDTSCFILHFFIFHLQLVTDMTQVSAKMQHPCANIIERNVI